MPYKVLEGKKVEAIMISREWGFTIDNVERSGSDRGSVYQPQITDELPNYKVAEWELNDYGIIEYSEQKDYIPENVTDIIRLNAVRDGRDGRDG